MNIARIIIPILFILCLSHPVQSAEPDLAKFLPAPVCAEGWTMDGKVSLFDKDTLFDRINGESELYFPYGFTRLAYARYANAKDPKLAIDADVYAMGSLLDAFGIFANYRRKDSPAVDLGAGGTASPSQALFYQDRYFVRLQVTGAVSMDENVLLSCARAIARNLPQNAGRPKELELLAVPAVLRGSERYIARSLLGYEFFRRGLIADALLSHDKGQVFVVFEQSPEAARSALDQYHAYLRASGSDAEVERKKERVSLSGQDPLYGAVYVAATGRFLVGAVRFGSTPKARQAAEQVMQMGISLQGQR